MPGAPNFPELEEEILKFWQKKNIFKKTLEKNSPKGNFVFYEGPPTANGRPGIHHVLTRAFKDVIPRYKTMQGYHVPRKAGWDTHGLPVELQVEKELEISGKPDIEKYGVEKFNKKCKASVWKYQDEWERMTSRVAFWLDLENPYVTYSNDYIESVWNIMKHVDAKGLLYLGHKVVPHCPRCGTALSSHEVAQGYKEVEEESIYVKFPVKGEKNTYLLSWTTTPWTLPGNVALAVGRDINYSKVKYGDEYYILATELLDEVLEEGNYEIVDKMRGENLEGLEYEPIFPGALNPGDKKAWYVAVADFVTTEDGTGIVHTAVMYGEDDYELGEKLDLPKVHTVDEEGKFKESVSKWSGKFVKDPETQKSIIRDLDERGLLLKEKMYKHEYPFCWRCDTPLLYYAKDSWFIKMSSLREELKKENRKINWVPSYIKEGRFGEWLEGAKDWAISRERFWGTPIPIWICDSCGDKKVVGSYAELEEFSGEKIDEDFDPHKPYIDNIKLQCAKCGGEMSRTREVLDCWFDSGSMPFAQDYYPFDNKEKIDSGERYPAQFISEAIDQTRGWFYTLLAIGVLMDKGTPYKNVICLGHINDAEGKKMSKSKGNVINPWEMFDKYGADAVRMYFYTVNQPGDTKNFDPKGVEEVLRRDFIVLWNVLNFYKMYVSSDSVTDLNSDHILDKWILAKLSQLTKETTKFLDEYDEVTPARKISEFINDLSTWYVRRSRDRFKKESEEKKAALNVFRHAINTLVKLMAPFTPFTAEAIYGELGGDRESIHLEDWPEIEDGFADDEVLANMERTRNIVELALAAREEAGIKVRQPLGRIEYAGKSLSEEYEKLIAEELNVREVGNSQDIKESDNLIIKENKNEKAGLDIEITPDLKKEGYIRELTRHINSLRRKEKLTIKDRVDLFVDSKSELIKEAVEEYGEKLSEATLSRNIELGKGENDAKNTVQIDGQEVWLGIKKYN